MGTIITPEDVQAPVEINDTLKISKGRQGFPEELVYRRFVANPQACIDAVLGKQFRFWKKGERLYHRPPTRVFLAEAMPDGKWLYWGHALVLEQKRGDGETSGIYQVTKIYYPQAQQVITLEESPEGKSFLPTPCQARPQVKRPRY